MKLRLKAKLNHILNDSEEKEMCNWLPMVTDGQNSVDYYKIMYKAANNFFISKTYREYGLPKMKKLQRLVENTRGYRAGQLLDKPIALTIELLQIIM